MEIFRKYLSSFGTWYVQVWVDGSLIELPFDHEPEMEEIKDWANALETGESYGDSNI